jgi:site-specific DNA recombinase
MNMEGRNFMRCAIVVRVSTGRIEQESSLENQKRLFYKYVAENGWDIYDFYVDQKSGTTEKREGLQRLFEDGLKGKYDIILAKELSRLARNVSLAYKIKDMGEQHNLDLITLDGAINTLEKKGNMFGLYAWIYELESQNTSERLKVMFKTKAQMAEFTGSNPPYGYEIEDKKLKVRSDSTPNIVRRIFSEYIAGKGFDAIARGLYNDGIITPSQLADKKKATDKWHGSSIRKILENPHYTGTLQQCRDYRPSVTSKRRRSVNPANQIIIEQSHEPIIDLDQFLIVQQLMETRKRRRPQAEIHLFTNTAVCKDCGRSMHFKKNRKGYVCGNYNKHGIKACSDHYVSEVDLTETVKYDLNRIYEKFSKEDYFKELSEKSLRYKEKLETKIIEINNKLEDKKRDKSNLVISLANGVITKEDYQLAITITNGVISNLETSVQQLTRELEYQSIEKEIIDFKKSLDKFIKQNNLTPEMLHMLIDKIEIHADGTVEVHYRFREPTVPSA